MKSNWAQYLGRISYSFYLVRGVVFSAFWFLLPWLKLRFNLAGFSPIEKLGYMAVFVTAVLAISPLTYLFIERPARLFLLSLRKGTKTARRI